MDPILHLDVIANNPSKSSGMLKAVRHAKQLIAYLESSGLPKGPKLAQAIASMFTILLRNLIGFGGYEGDSIIIVDPKSTFITYNDDDTIRSIVYTEDGKGVPPWNLCSQCGKLKVDDWSDSRFCSTACRLSAPAEECKPSEPIEQPTLKCATAYTEGLLPFLCTEPKGHEPSDHIARDICDDICAQWPSVTPAAPSTSST